MEVVGEVFEDDLKGQKDKMKFLDQRIFQNKLSRTLYETVERYHPLPLHIDKNTRKASEGLPADG